MPISLIVADDSTLSRKMLIRSLPPQCQFEISQCGNGAEVLEACRQSVPDVLCLDLTMPVMDGFQVLEALQQASRRPRVVVVSADIQPKARERVNALGAIAFIRKPVEPAVLAEALRSCGCEVP